MEFILFKVPALHWALMLIGFAVHVLMKLQTHLQLNQDIKAYFSSMAVVTMLTSLLMSIGLLIAGHYQFPNSELLGFISLGAGYMNNSLWTNVMQISTYKKVGNNE
jgi:hypothetical protein